MDCPRCGGEIQENEAAFCPHCGSRLFAGPEGRRAASPGEETPPGDPRGQVPPLVTPPEGTQPGPSPPEGQVPFEDSSLSFPVRLLATVKAALFRPGALFSNLSPGGLGAPLLYGLIMGVLGWIFWALWYPPTRDWAIEAAQNMPPEMQGGMFVEILKSSLTNEEVRNWVILSPLVTLAALFVTAGLFHLTLVLLGGGERGFRVSFRAVCYGATTFLLLALPFCGQLLAYVWGLVLVAVGLARGHRSAGWQAAFAVIIPVFFTCCLLIGLDILALLSGGGLGG